MKNKPVKDDDSLLQLSNEEGKNDIHFEATDEFIPVKSKSETYHLIDVKKQKKSRKIFGFAKDTLDDTELLTNSRAFGGKFRLLPIALSFAVLIIVLGVLYIFLEKDSILTSEPKNVLIKVTPPPYVNVIERDYEFAVTFPYTPSESGNQILGIDPSVFESGVKIVEQKPEPVETKKELKEKSKTEVKVEDKPEPVLTERNKNITKYKDYYIVQVSAYRSYTAAEEEAEKFRDQGYNAFIEIAEVPGKGTWYRIKVGDFTSIKHAEDFLIKNRNQ
jgi:cell division septation protein DedD